MLKRLLSFLILMFITAYAAKSQIIITSEDFKINHEPEYHLQPLSGFSEILPAEGEDILWTYFDVDFSPGEQRFSFQELPEDPVYPDADFISESIYFGVNVTYYTKAGEDNWNIPGAYIPETKKMIDSEENIYVHIPEQISDFEPPVIQFSFPLEYGDINQQDDWSYRETEFILNVPGVYEEAPGRIIERRDIRYEINGWGELQLPGYANPIEVLMIRTELTIVDSVYLNGQPAPPQALTLLGLNQGGITFSDNIHFLCKEYPLPVLTLNIGEEGDIYAATMVRNPAMSENSIEITSEDFGKNATAEYHLQDVEETDFNIENWDEGHYWNFSGLTDKGLPYQERFWPAGENPPIEEAALMMNKNIEFSSSGYATEAELFFTLWSTALQYLGNKYSSESIFFDDDETVRIKIPEQVSRNSLSLPVYSFPMLYGKEKVVNTVNRSMDFTITAPGFFNEAPGILKRYETLSNEIIAWGQVYLHDYSEPLSVVVNKREKTLIDSIFLEGIPAPEDFLQQIGLQQGKSTTTITYEFMARDFSHPVMEIFADQSGEVFLARYITGKPLSVAETKEENITLVFPNPVTSSTMQLSLSEDIINGQIQIYGQSGRMLSVKRIFGNSGDRYKIKLDESLSNGVYFFKIIDTGKIIDSGKFILLK